MAGRIRSIKPEILEDEKTAGMSHEAWRLWVSMWLLADDHGRLRGAVPWLHAQVFWATHANTQQALDDLVKLNVVRLYVLGGQQYIEITNWTRHQKVDHPGNPRVPAPLVSVPSSRESRDGVASSSEGVAPDLRSGPRSPTTITDHSSSTSSPSVSFDFEALYELYPRKAGKTIGLRRCKRAIKTVVDFERLRKAIVHYAAACTAQRTETQYIKQFSTFMGCWEDYVDAAPVNGTKQFRNVQQPRAAVLVTGDEDL